MHISPHIQRLPTSPTLAMHERSAALIAKGRDIARFGFGQSPFPIPDRVTEALVRHAHAKAYLPVQGLPALRQAIASYLQRDGHPHTASDILIGPGSKELMFHLQLALDPDTTTLLIPTPAWVSYAPQALLAQRPHRLVPTRPVDRWCLTPEALEAATTEDRDHLLILTSPDNPTGVSYSSDTLEALAHVARRRRILVLSDEIYGELHHRDDHLSIAQHLPERTIIASGLSKWCGAGGWRLGFFAFPNALAPLREAMMRIASETFSAASAPVQHAACVAYTPHPDLQRYRHDTRRILAALAQTTCATLRSADISVATPDGGFYVFPDFSRHTQALAALDITTSEALCAWLLDTAGVALLPGTAFGRPPHELTARLAFVDFDGAAALDAARTTPEEKSIDDAFLRRHTVPTLDGLKRLTLAISDLH